jgi:hypothetical protein
MSLLCFFSPRPVLRYTSPCVFRTTISADKIHIIL